MAQSTDLAPTPSVDAVEVPLNAPIQERGDVFIYTNGAVSNSQGTGVGGVDESILQNATLGTGLFGLGAQNAAATIIADDLVVPEGDVFNIDSVAFYAYQSFAGNVSTITGVFVEIRDGDSTTVGDVIYGDQTTNVLLTTQWTEVYRVTEASAGTSSDRAIMEVVADVDTTLGEGHYWLAFSFTGSADSGPWAPPVPTNGECYPGNTQQNTGQSWTKVYNINEMANTGCDEPFGMEMPFLVYGNVSGVATESGPTSGSFALSAPRPNPARDQAALTLRVEEPQAVRVEAFDLLGRRVAVLHDGLVASGSPLTLSLDTQDLPAGVYVVRAVGNSEVQAQRVTVAR